MPPPKGTTNNPNGRPPKSRALTDLLVKALAKKIDVDGKQLPRKAILAELVADVLATGRLKFPGDMEASIISVKDWLEFVKWAYNYMEPPAQKTELTGEGGGAVAVSIIEVVRPAGNADGD